MNGISKKSGFSAKFVNLLSFYFSKYIYSIEKYITAEFDLKNDILFRKIDDCFSVYKITPDNINEFRTVGNFTKEKLFRERIRGDYIGFMIKDNSGRIAGYSWIVTSNYFSYLVNRLFTLQKGREAYLVDDYIFENFRGRGIQTYITGYRLSYLKSQGYSKILVSYNVNNEFSRRNFLKNGFIEKELTIIVKLAGSKFNKTRKILS